MCFNHLARKVLITVFPGLIALALEFAGPAAARINAALAAAPAIPAFPAIPATPAPAAPEPGAPGAPGLRLPASVRPTAVALALNVDPAQARHSGEVVIDLQLTQATGRIELHAQDLQVHAASAQLPGARTLPARVTMRPQGSRLVLAFDSALPAGPAQLRLAFSGRLQEQTFSGLYRQHEAGQWAAFSHFQPNGARRVFPLFDEPGWKLPWTLSLTVPEALTAVSNMPTQRQTSERAGWTTWHFAPTPPLPSYLLGFAVGRFDVRPGPSLGKLPIRVLTPPGRAAEAAEAAAATAQALDRLQAYFGLPYPFAKLDSLAVPVAAGFAAMEHPGLITYASHVLLAPPAPLPPRWRADLLATVAHELAHQWFGNLVSPAWWDDLWLNEAFASWLGDRTSAELQPGWAAVNLVRARAAAMQADQLPGARRIEQPVDSEQDLAGLWDPIAYEKGQLLIGMAEAWLGPDRFRDAVRRYIARHARGSARSDDFFAALAATDPTLPTLLRSFTRQVGVPLLRLELRCSSGPPQLLLSQEALRPPGVAAPVPASATGRWQLPLQLRTPAGISRFLLTDIQATLALPDKSCPAWVQANVSGLGYYRVAYPPALQTALAGWPELPVVEALVLLDDARSLQAHGLLSQAALLALVQRFATQPQPELALAAAEALRQLQPLQVPASHARHWQTLFGARARALGWLTRPGDSAALQSLRAGLLPLLADAGEDTALRAQARQLAQTWLLDREQLDAAMRRPVLATSALDADSAWFETLRSALRASNHRSEQEDLLGALGQVRTPALAERARQSLLAPGQDLRLGMAALLGAQAGQAATRAGALAFLARHQAVLVSSLPVNDAAGLPGLFIGACSADEARAIDAAFARSARASPAGRLALSRVLETVRLCAAGRDAGAALR